MLFGAIAALVALAAQDAPSEPAALQCDTGPVTKVYGGSEWLVYACSDERSLVFVSAPGSPAMPFYFLSTPSTEGYQLAGEGTGAEEATRPAYEDLAKLTDNERQALLDETGAVAAAPSR